MKQMNDDRITKYEFVSRRYPRTVRRLPRTADATTAAKKKHTRSVWVKHGRQHCCGSGGSIKKKYNDKIVLLSSSVERCVRGFLGMRGFRCSSKGFLYQKLGIPIGGPLSGAVLDVVFSEAEANADNSVRSRGRLVACGRYVADAVLISKLLCESCRLK